MFLIVMDTYSKWLEVIPLKHWRCSEFVRYGLPQVLVSDNGPEFTAHSVHMQANNIKGAPYHPTSNREAELFAQTFKRALQDREGPWNNET